MSNKGKLDIKFILIAVVALLILFNQYQLHKLNKAVEGMDMITGAAVSGEYETVDLDFYVMSQCPYGTQVEDAIKPVKDELGDALNLDIDFIANDNGDGTFGSLHGQPEVDGDIVQLCAKKYYPKNYLDFIFCQNKNAADLTGTIESCASKNDMDGDKIRACFEGDEGKELLSESIEKSDAVGASGSPTIFLAGLPYNGGRDALSFKRALCANLKGHPACAEMPECGSDRECTAEQGKVGKCENPGKKDAKCVYSDPVPVEFIILNDDECKNCDTTQITLQTRQLFLGAKQRNVDVKSEEGKKLIAELGITKVPAYIFDEKLVETGTWKTNTDVRTVFEKKGNRYKITDEIAGATYFIDEEARKKYQEAIGLTLGDNKPQIDFFVMSYCPYGNIAEEMIEPVYQNLKEKAEFNPRYVIYSNYAGGGPDYCLDDGKYCSMHGIQELNQNIREICVDKYMGIGKWFEFVMAMNEKCSSNNADACWVNVAEDLGLDVGKIRACEKDEGVELVKKEKELNDLLGVRGSPTIFIEGEEFSGQRSSAGYQNALCAVFDEKPSECSNVIVEPAGVEPAAAAGGCG